MRFNRARKNKHKNLNTTGCEFSEGFIRRMSAPLSLTPYTPTPEQAQRFDMLAKEHFSPQTKEIEEFLMNSARYHAEYLESVKNGTNIF